GDVRPGHRARRGPGHRPGPTRGGPVRPRRRRGLPGERDDMTAVIEVQGLHAGRGGVPVVRDLDLRVEQGELVALLGPNGAGKTTTLLALSGILAVLAGNVAVLGAVVRAGATSRLARLGLAHVPEERCLFPGLTVGEHLRLAEIGRASCRERVEGWG